MYWIIQKKYKSVKVKTKAWTQQFGLCYIDNDRGKMMITCD